ncbi:hypothetical protein OG612_39355 [Streptomyces sp. NBC_01527]|nr:hypothetical protein OG763_03585 [Streptomyces sp. NBC_01230]
MPREEFGKEVQERGGSVCVLGGLDMRPLQFLVPDATPSLVSWRLLGWAR